ncbi:MAG TPA: polysaccharide deacetylase family protein [Armatimonadota bacterium]|nr:polysaccharide deacetylase family protein [Armatimonadota bacterium]
MQARGLLIAAPAFILLSGCAPACQTSPLQTIRPGPSYPLTAAIREKARADYLASEQIRAGIVTEGSTQKKMIALSFDDGPHPGRTEPLLRALSHAHVHATFFVIGKMVVRAPYLIQDEINQGSEVGNHTYNHIHVTSLTDSQIATEIFEDNDVIRRYTGEPAVLFRPPGGRVSWGAYRALRACGMVTTLWTDDPKDYVNPGKPDPAQQKLLLERLMKHLHPGGIILLHDGILDTVAILPEFIRRVRAQGYQIVTVTQLLLAKQRAESHSALLASEQPPREQAMLQRVERSLGSAPAIRVAPVHRRLKLT